MYNLDLVEISPNANPPVCKIIDYGKYQYEKKKKEKKAKKKQHTVSVKELRFRPNTDDHDLEFKTRHAREFLEGGDKVKASVQFRGRDMLYTEKGELLLLRLAKSLEDVAKIESKPNMEGRRMIMILSLGPISMMLWSHHLPSLLLVLGVSFCGCHLYLR